MRRPAARPIPAGGCDDPHQSGRARSARTISRIRACSRLPCWRRALQRVQARFEPVPQSQLRLRSTAVAIWVPGVIRQACEHCDLPWGHVSSGCIYTGARADGRGFTEEDMPNFCFRTNNCSFYSGCKALGEECLAGSEKTYSWRLRIPFNEVDSSRNYLSKLMLYDRLLQATNSISGSTSRITLAVSYASRPYSSAVL